MVKSGLSIDGFLFLLAFECWLSGFVFVSYAGSLKLRYIFKDFKIVNIL